MFGGIFLLDIEVELAWGMLDIGMNKEKMINISQRARTHLQSIIDLLEKYNISVTWGILGHLLLHRSVGESKASHPEIPRKSPNDESAFYGKDVTDKIIKYVLKTKTPHDIACHSFSHMLLGDPKLDKMVAETEVKRSVQILKETYGVVPKVFIFPKNDVGYLEVLKMNDFIAFRGPIPQLIDYSETARGIKNSVRKYVSLTSQLAAFYLKIPPRVVEPKEENGLINIPASMCFNKKPLLPLGLVLHKAIKGIDRAIRERKVFHLFTHLVNFGQPPEGTAFVKSFEKILAYANLCREKGGLEITTMRKIAEDYFSKPNGVTTR